MQEQVQDFVGAHDGSGHDEPVVVRPEVQMSATTIRVIVVTGRIEVEPDEIWAAMFILL